MKTEYFGPLHNREIKVSAYVQERDEEPDTGVFVKFSRSDLPEPSEDELELSFEQACFKMRSIFDIYRKLGYK